MGKYINEINGVHIGTSFNEKCSSLENDGAESVSGDTYYPDLVCVVDNGPFAAAGWAFDEDEWKSFNYPCGRRKAWFRYPEASKYAGK